MSMVKLCEPNDMQAPLTSLVQAHSRGVDRDWLRKSAAVLTDELSNLRPEPGHSFIHLLAMGCSEKYGPNRNADGFKSAMLERDHPTFVTDGAVYKYHRNRPERGDKVYGEIKNAAWNREMGRVELIIRVPDRDWGEELEKLANDEEVPFSMSVKVPYDVCSICKNRAPTRRQYCGCMRKYAGQILDDGRQVYVDNPRGRFFDISKVGRPADRIAYGFRKAASASGAPVVTGAELGEAAYPAFSLTIGRAISKQASAKLAMLRKLAEIEKEIEADAAGSSELARTFVGGAKVHGNVSEKLSKQARKRLASQLARMQISLPLADFMKIMCPGEECDCDCRSLFRDVLEDEDACERVIHCGDFDADSPGSLPPEIDGLIDGLTPLFGMGRGPAMRRATLVIAKKAEAPDLRRGDGFHGSPAPMRLEPCLSTQPINCR